MTKEFTRRNVLTTGTVALATATYGLTLPSSFARAQSDAAKATSLPNFPPGFDVSTAQTCSFLVNVGVAMGKKWIADGKPVASAFSWQPKDTCPVTSASPYTVDQFSFGKPIWSRFQYLRKTYEEPFGLFARNRTDSGVYLIFRGSQTRLDFALDAEISKVHFGGNPARGKVEKGFYDAFEGLREELESELGRVIGTLTVTGHSLGSALATLSSALAADAFRLTVHQYNQASPRVGNQQFVKYFESMKNLTTFRLVNTVDKVPKMPPERLGYRHVGTAVEFTKDYGSEGKNHNPCCSYAYAILNPGNPVNPNFETCLNNFK